MIYILEGPDGTGKTTLAREIYDQSKGHILHCTWDKRWDMKRYFNAVMSAARQLSEFQDVIIDRWAPSEHVYGVVFRGGPQFDIHDYLWESGFDIDMKFIYCRNDNAVQNHLKNKQERIEMFEDMGQVVKEFDEFVESTDYLKWTVYDYDKVDMKQFVKELLDERKAN